MENGVLINMEKWLIFLSSRVTDDIALVWTRLVGNIQPDNCSELSQLDVPLTKKKLDVALKTLKKWKLIRDTSKADFYMISPEYVLYDMEKYNEYVNKFSQKVITTQRYPKRQ